MEDVFIIILHTKDQTEKWITGVIFVFSEGQKRSEWRGQLSARAEAEDALSLGGPGESHDTRQIIITVPHNTLLQVSCYSTARMDRVLFTEAGAEAGDPGSGPIGCGADQETETRGLDTFGGCLSSLTR